MGIFEVVKAKAYEFDWLTLRTSETDVNTLATTIIDWILSIAGLLAVIYLIYAGIVYITAGGNPDAAKKGQQGIINAVIGLVVIALAWVIARSVASFLA